MSIHFGEINELAEKYELHAENHSASESQSQRIAQPYT